MSVSKIAKVVAFLFVVQFAPAAEPVWEWSNNYQGRIGRDYPIGMTLIFKDRSVTGVYFYHKHLRDIRLTGELDGKGGIRLHEHSAGGRKTAVFEGRCVGRDKSDGRRDVIAGDWRKLTGGKTLPFRVELRSATARQFGEGRYAVAGAEDDEALERAVQRFWNAVKEDRRAVVAKCFYYPFSVERAGRRLKLKSAADLERHYETIMTPALRAKILEAIPHNMFAKDVGVMLGRGEVWFDSHGRVITLSE